jgi:hypothetical protein
MKKRLISLAGWSLAAALAFIPGLLMAAAPVTLDPGMTYNIKQTVATGVTSSTTAVVGVGLAWRVDAPAGSTCTFTIAHTTRTFSSASVAVSSVTSPAIVVPAAGSMTGTFSAYTVNPAIVLHGLSTLTTAYVTIEYGQARAKN